MVLLETALWNLFFLCKFTKAVIYVTVVIADKIKYSFFLLSLIFSKIVSIIIYCTCICVIFLYFLLLSGYYFSNSYIFKKMSSNVYELNINHFICISNYNRKSAVFCFTFDALQIKWSQTRELWSPYNNYLRMYPLSNVLGVWIMNPKVTKDIISLASNLCCPQEKRRICHAKLERKGAIDF